MTVVCIPVSSRKIGSEGKSSADGLEAVYPDLMNNKKDKPEKIIAAASDLILIERRLCMVPSAFLGLKVGDRPEGVQMITKT